MCRFIQAQGEDNLNKQWGLFGTWCEIHESDVDFLTPNNYKIEHYYDAPLEDYEQLNLISTYMNDKYGIEDENIIIYWKGYVNLDLRPPDAGAQKQVIGIAYHLENGIFIIMRMSKNQFLYAFYTSLELQPDFPLSKYKKIKEILYAISQENGLKLNRKTKFFNPEFYSMKEKVGIHIFKNFEENIVKIEEQFEIPFYNPSTLL